MHPTRAASLIAALGVALILAALGLRALSLGQAFAQLAQDAASEELYPPALGGYVVSADGETVSFIQAPFSAPRTTVSWYRIPVNGGIPTKGIAPDQNLRPFHFRNGQVFVTEGTTQRQISPPNEQVTEAHLSPDGKFLAFAAKTEGGRARLYVLSETADLEWLGEEDAVIDLDWSSDGKMLAFIAPRERVDQVFSASADGQQYHQLTTDGARKSRPRWSPDGSTIAYIAVEGGDSPSIGQATPTAPPVIRTPAGIGLPPAYSRADIYLINADGSNARRLTSTPEPEMALAWLRTNRGAELSFALRLTSDPQVAYLYAIDPTSGKQRRVYPTVTVDALECPAQISAGSPAVVKITVSNSALVQQDLPLILRAREHPFQPYEDLQANAVRRATVDLLPGETRVLDWEANPSAGRVTYFSIIANTDPRLPLSELNCSTPNTYFGLPRLPYLALSVPLLLTGMALCLPRLLQIRRRLLWFLWASSLIVFWILYVYEMKLP